MANKPVADKLFYAAVVTKKWLSKTAFELTFEKPENFVFLAGQKITVMVGSAQREYTLVSSPEENRLSLCVRHVSGGLVSAKLAELTSGDQLTFSAAYGYFLHRPGRSVFVATGTGIAPFVSFCKSGAGNFYLLHGVRDISELYYRQILEKGASHYIPCIPASMNITAARDTQIYSGRVTEYLHQCLPRGDYNFYLCGNGEMVGAALRIIDDNFHSSKIFTETFFHN